MRKRFKKLWRAADRLLAAKEDNTVAQGLDLSIRLALAEVDARRSGQRAVFPVTSQRAHSSAK